jgi:hypothetical protein
MKRSRPNRPAARLALGVLALLGTGVPAAAEDPPTTETHVIAELRRLSVGKAQVPAPGQYVTNVEEHHRKADSREEWLGLLSIHGLVERLED